MRFSIFILVLFGFHWASFAQDYPCEAPDSILTMYQDDADRMAIARTFQNGSTWMDSVGINPEFSQTAMSALVAVYNSTSPQRDTVVDLLNIHIYPIMPLRSLTVSADSSLAWVQQLQAGNVPTGEPILDGLMQQYDVVDFNLWGWPSNSHKVITFNMGTNWNLLPLLDLFEQIPGAIYASPNGTVGDGDRITDSVYTDHIELTYSFGWGDCPAGCGGFYHWVFSVQPDCSVEFIGSYGLSPFFNTQVAEVPRTSLLAWPNPVSDVLHLGRSVAGEALTLYSIDGRHVGSPVLQGDGIDVRGLPPGIYFLRRSDRPWEAPLRFEVVH